MTKSVICDNKRVQAIIQCTSDNEIVVHTAEIADGNWLSKNRKTLLERQTSRSMDRIASPKSRINLAINGLHSFTARNVVLNFKL